jgi:hypothetical protein|nr:MAG TPA: hypothetical protein [Caudoviricetes sp.]
MTFGKANYTVRAIKIPGYYKIKIRHKDGALNKAKYVDL